MSYYKKEWLPHLKASIPGNAGINGISLYTISLEGWRRNLELKFYSRYQLGETRITYSLSDGNQIHYFDDSSGDANTDEAIEISGDKHTTNIYLEKAHIPIPKGKRFLKNIPLDKLVQYGDSLGYPVVVKPTDGLAGRGVIANIQSKDELKQAILFVRDTLNFNELIIQKHISGEEVRIYVLDGEVLAAVNRKPAHVVGDGQNSIAKLIRNTNKKRKLVPHIKYRPIKIDREVRQAIEQEGLTLDSVLDKERELLLREISNISQGGDPIDVTDQLTEDQKQIAINATQAIPGLIQCGVDMMIDSNTNKGYIIELNASPGIGSHLFPIKGYARDIPKSIIDYYFPDSGPIQTESTYDLQEVFNLLNSGLVSELTVPKKDNHTKVDTDIRRKHIIELEDENRYSYIEYRPLEREVERLKHRINLTKESLSWRVTSPLRKLLNRNKE